MLPAVAIDAAGVRGQPLCSPTTSATHSGNRVHGPLMSLCCHYASSSAQPLPLHTMSLLLTAERPCCCVLMHPAQHERTSTLRCRME